MRRVTGQVPSAGMLRSNLIIERGRLIILLERWIFTYLSVGFRLPCTYSSVSFLSFVIYLSVYSRVGGVFLSLFYRLSGRG